MLWTLPHKLMAGGIGALVLGIGLAWWSAVHAATVNGQAREKIRIADSTIKANASALHRTDTAVVHDVKTTTAYIDRYHADTLWRHDTVRVAGDTTARLAIPLPAVARTDSTIRACQALTNDCAAFRAAANATLLAQQSKIAALSSQIKAQGSIWRRCGIGAGVAATYAAGRIEAGPAIVASCRFWP